MIQRRESITIQIIWVTRVWAPSWPLPIEPLLLHETHNPSSSINKGEKLGLATCRYYHLNTNTAHHICSN